MHDPIIYIVGLRRADGQSKHEVEQQITTSFTPGSLTFNLVALSPEAEAVYSFDYSLYQGLLLEDGLDVKFYTTDNFQQYDVQYGPGYGIPQDVARIMESLIRNEADSPEWHRYHRERDNFSVKISTVVKPLYNEVYEFRIGSALVRNTDQRNSGVELWVDNYLVIQDG